MAVITSPITGKQISDANVGNIMGLLYEDLATLISGADITLRYPEFERSYGEWGGMLTEGRIAAAQGQTVNKNTTLMCDPAYFSVDARYYDEWIEAVYPSEIRRIDLTKILRGEMEYADFLRRVVQRNVEGYRADVNKSIDKTLVGDIEEYPYNNKALIQLRSVMEGFTGFLTAAVGGKKRYEILTGAEQTAAPSFKDVYAAILSEAMHMTVENSDYTEGDAEYGASMEDLVIYLPIDFIANSDIRYIQDLFNRSGIDKLPEIRPHNGAPIHLGSYPDNTYGEGDFHFAFILDKRVINHVQRYMGYDDAPNDCRKSERISLHVEHMTKYSPFYKAWAFGFKMPTA